MVANIYFVPLQKIIKPKMCISYTLYLHKYKHTFTMNNVPTNILIIIILLILFIIVQYYYNCIYY